MRGTDLVGIMVEGVAAELSLLVSSLEATEGPTNSYLAETTIAGGRLLWLPGRGGRGEKAGPRVLSSGGDGDTTPGMTRRSHVVPDKR